MFCLEIMLNGLGASAGSPLPWTSLTGDDLRRYTAVEQPAPALAQQDE
ncbi:hypothetical protein IMZ11_06610 [Microtetraspora sp. AC03309]|nr:hypothetical protein [Microtetraspora sp. AC03309]MCC5575313.1 hypothetical protein [Microtetraspora sp. AC03309]